MNRRLTRLFRAVRVPLAGYLLVGATLYAAQDVLLLHPGPPSASIPTSFAPEGDYIGIVREPETPARATVVVFHGNAGSVSDRAYLAKPLTALGYRVVLVEYPGFGRREGSARLAELGARSIADFDLVRGRYPGPVAVLGESLGAAMAAAVAAARSDAVCNLVLITPWNRLSEVAQEKFPIFPARILLKANYPTDLALQRYAGPVTIVAAERDAVIPSHHARTLAQGRPDAQWVLLPGVGHNDWPVRVGVDDWQRWIAAGCG